MKKVFFTQLFSKQDKPISRLEGGNRILGKAKRRFSLNLFWGFAYLMLTTLVVVIFTACEAPIEFPLNGSPNKIVVEGYISGTGLHYVALTRNNDYNDSIKIIPITNAFVLVTDNTGQRDTFIETLPGLYVGYKLQGVPHRHYYMTAIVGSDTLTAATTLPNRTPIDTVTVYWQEERTVARKPAFYTVVYNKDPDTMGNFYRLMFYRNGSLPIFPIEYILLDDRFFNGKNMSHDLAYNCDSGDSVDVVLRSLDRTGYEIFESIVTQKRTGTPFTGPGENILTNIKGNGVGFFLGENSSTYSLRIP